MKEIEKDLLNVDARFVGMSVFETAAAELVRQIERLTPFDATDPELGYSYVFHAHLALWRQVVPEDGADPEGHVFDTVGVGVVGYYGGAS